MNTKIYLSMACALAISANAADLGTIEVAEKLNVKVVQNVSADEVKSADLAEALNKNIPSITLIRRSGIANDIMLRGQKRDNIKVTIDGTSIHGACVNRMDPPTSHVVTHAVDNVEVREGPFDVEEFGTLSGSVKITTKKPSEKLVAEVNLNAGSYDYKKASATVSAGNDKVKILLSASKEEGGQYKDGNGNNFSTQLKNYTQGTTVTGSNYQTQYEDMDAFSKTMFMGKVFVDIDDKQELKLSYTANRSDDILYPSSKMDAIYDDSDIANLQYSIRELSTASNKLDLQVYNSKVDHPMSTQYRVAGAAAYMINHLTTESTGIKIKNNVTINNHDLTYGIDTSKRNWDGAYTKTTIASGAVMSLGDSLSDVASTNTAFFAKHKKRYGKLDVESGLRYDSTKVTTASSTLEDTSFTSLGANIFTTYKVSKSLKYFVGVGKSNRIPDARELYNTKPSMMGNAGVINGTPTLNQTTNYEIDLGVEKKYSSSAVKFKMFYSKLKDYIYYNSSIAMGQNAFENIDATIYGAELSTSYLPSDDLFLEAGLSYKKGQKDTLTTNQTDKDLAEMSPTKLNASATYDYDDKGDVKVSVIGAGKWSNVDEENGEQELASYAVLNLKTTREITNSFNLTVGIDNVFDKTYTATNTYKDLILMTDNSDTMLINEPGRYFYLNAKYKF